MKNKDRKFTPQYIVSDVAKMLDLHPQSIRYYDNIKVVEASKESQNQQRLYSTYDVFKILQVKQYQNIGFTLDEITNIFTNSNMDELISNLNKRIETQAQTLLRLQSNQNSAIEFLQILNNIPIFLNRCFYKVRPAEYVHPHVRDGHVLQNENATKARTIAMDAFPKSKVSLIIPLEDIQQLKTRAKSKGSDITVGITDDLSQEFSTLEETYILESAPCLYTIVKIEEFEELSWKHLEFVESFLKQNQLKIVDDVRGTILLNILDPDTQCRYRYFQVWIPIN